MEIDQELCTHVREIRDRLWNGEAAVMIGAGFSRNAVPLHSESSSISTWKDLKRKLQQRLSQGCGNGNEEEADRDEDREQDKNRKKEKSLGDAAEIGEEFEQVFGRTELREVIKRSVPDDKYEPGELHRMLLGLPWRDVFTTNYDRLLERTRSEIIDRRYDFVQSPEQLPKAHQPRIIKLHGDFNLSNERLIFTREDYRTYPEKHAPFVNTVRQSLMENSFVLIGFSGDDPNFKSWLGWVRDVLAERSHTTYLCDLHENMTLGRKRVLLRDGIQPVDLSLVAPGESNKYERGLRWLFCSLYAGQPPNGQKWPQPTHRLERWDCEECNYLAPSENLKEEEESPPQVQSGAG